MTHTNTSRFEASHGRKPRGRGTWAFDVTAWNSENNLETSEQWASSNKTLTEARREVVSRFERGSVVELTVLP